jgi:hypothetical protein
MAETVTIGKVKERLRTYLLAAESISLDKLVNQPWEAPHIPQERGLYALCSGAAADLDGLEVLYLGQSKDLRRRIGQLLGAALTGALGLHIAGWRLCQERGGEAQVATLHRRILHVVWWVTPRAQELEPALIGELPPPLNRQHTGGRRTAPSTPVPAQNAMSNRPAWLTDELCEGLFASVGAESPKGPQSAGWAEGWAGWTAEDAENPGYTLWLGFCSSDAVRLWVLEAKKEKESGASQWHSAEKVGGTDKNEATTEEELKQLFDWWQKNKRK